MSQSNPPEATKPTEAPKAKAKAKAMAGQKKAAPWRSAGCQDLGYWQDPNIVFSWCFHGVVYRYCSRSLLLVLLWKAY